MAFIKSKGYSPIGSDGDCHEAPEFTLERMQVESWKIHIFYGTGCVQACQDIAKFGQVVLNNSSWIIVLIEPFQPLVTEGSDHSLS